MFLSGKKINYSLAGLFLFSLLFFVLIFAAKNFRGKDEFREIKLLLREAKLDIGNEEDRAVFQDAIENFYGKSPKSDSLLALFENYKNSVLTDRASKTGSDVRTLNLSLALELLGKAALFFLRFAFIGFLLFYLSESFALMKFKLIRQKKNNVTTNLRELIDDYRRRNLRPSRFPFGKSVAFVLLAAAKFFGYLVLFSPVYLVGYAFKFDYENLSFAVYVALAVFTNGVLILSVNKFLLLLENEYYKGYVETAFAKKTDADFSSNGKITPARIFSPVKFFGEHVLTPVYKNARLQFILTFKEIGRFLITSLIITELTLNYQNGLFYDMLQSLMKKELDVFLFVLMLVFWTVKLFDIFIERIFEKENSKYEN